MSLRFGTGKVVLGMVHLAPLPGTPFHEEGSFGRTLETAVRSARALYDGGATGCLVQTVDRVYPVADTADPARTAALALIVRAIADATGDGFHVGVQMMQNGVRPALAVAKVAGGGFVRVTALVGQTMSVHGLVSPDPHAIMEYRRGIDAMGITMIAEVATMHYSWRGTERGPGEVARGAQLVGADAVAVSHPVEEEAVALVAAVRRSAPRLPVLLAGHVNHDNAARLLSVADGAFVGTCLERDGWGGAIEVDRVRALMAIVDDIGETG
ncbi:BtpA/SgcQ family protein [Longispora urticae]